MPLVGEHEDVRRFYDEWIMTRKFTSARTEKGYVNKCLYFGWNTHWRALVYTSSTQIQ